MDRREMLMALGGAGMLAPWLSLERAMAQTLTPEQRSAQAHEQLMAVPGLNMHGNEQVAMLLYPGFTALDLVGPHYFFACMMGATVHLVSPDTPHAAVESDLKLAIQPTVTMADTPRDLDILFVPGGTVGTINAMKRADIVSWLADRGSRAKHVTSVCTGSMLLGKAGLLRGRRATSHWVTRPLLPEVGATPVDARVVTDGKVITGAGVSAGLDFGLAVVAALRGKPYAEALMLQAESHPEPPFPGGTIATTDPVIADPMQGMFAGVVEQFRAAARG